MAYGSSIRSFRPHTNAVKVGAALSNCGGDAQFSDVQKQAWGQQCGDGAQRLPLGTLAATVPGVGATTQPFQFQTVVPFRAFYLDIDDAIASQFLITSFTFGLRQLVVGGQVSAASFNTRNGKDCAEAFNGCIIYPSIPAILTVQNISGNDVFFRATMWGIALTSC